VHIWVDADACPISIKEILYKAVKRTQVSMTLVANQMIRYPRTPLINQIIVPSGFDKADDYIVQEMKAGDLVITGDIPLADKIISQQGHALNPRGELYTQNNIKQRLQVRNFNDTLRSTGLNTGGPAPLGLKEIQAFANNLDKLLTAFLRPK